MNKNGNFVSKEAQATLLLCAPLLASKQKGAAPLSPGEFNKLSNELQRLGASSPDLLEPEGSELLGRVSPEVDHEQVQALLGRGFLLGLALERWHSLGLWVLCRTDEAYPKRLKERLRQHAPPLLFGCGQPALLERGGLAIVGSREVDDQGAAFAEALARRCASEDMTVISGGAKGVDQIAMRSAADNGGCVIGIMANDLTRAATSGTARDLIREGRVCLASPFDPEAGFNVGNAMARNKVIYALADYGVVVSSGEKEGGTWAGAVEQIEKYRQIPIFVRSGENVPSGNLALIEKGGIPMTDSWKEGLREHLKSSSRPRSSHPVELLLGL